MKKLHIVVILGAAFVVLGLPLGATGQQAGEAMEPAASADTEEPQYGGTLTLRRIDSTPVNADATVSRSGAMHAAGPVLEHLTRVDYKRVGPRGSGEWSNTWVVCPEWVMTGNLAESWTAEPNRLTFNIRPGVMWQAMGKEHVMESRELTADDIVHSFTRILDSGVALIQWTDNGGWVREVYAVGDSVVFELSQFSSTWPYVIGAGWMNAIYAPETVEAGIGDWENMVGTGPFIFEERVEGSHISYVRNPDYWDTTVINGTEYEVPFIDRLVYATIDDQTTQLAALRTGKLDLFYRMSSKFEETLSKTNPDLNKVSNPWDWGYQLALRTDVAPLNNKEIRRALMMALDIPAINKAVVFGGEGDYHSYPVHSIIPFTHVALEDLPAQTRELWDFDPERAKQILAEQGYPDGMSLSGVAQGSNSEVLVAAKGYWEQIGVEVNIDVVENAIMGRMFWAGEDNDYQVGYRGMGQADALDAMQMYLGEHNWNWTRWDNPQFNQMWHDAVAALDTDERNRIIRDLSVMALDSVAYIPIGTGRELQYWWPWVRNYYGELHTADRTSGRFEADIWIDQDLKEQMGF